MSVPISRPGRGPSPRWHRRKDARPAELLSAALEVFAEHGFAAARLEDVGRRAGVTKGTIYLYFDDKEALFRAVVKEAILPNIVQAERDVEAFNGSAGALLREFLLGWWRVIGESNLSAVPKIVISEATHFPSVARFYYEEVVLRGQRLIASILERGIASGEFRPVDIASAVRLALAPLVIAVIHKHSLYSCVREAGSSFDARCYVETHIDIFLRGLAMTPAAEG